MSAMNRGLMRYILACVVLALSGFVVWVISTPAVAGLLFGDAAYEAAYSSPVYGFFGLPLLALPPLVAGLVLPKGFFLWGVATVFPYLPGAVWLTARTGPEVTYQTPDPGVGQILSHAFVEVVIFFMLVTVCTVAALFGGGARVLSWWLRGEPVARRLGLSRSSHGA